MNVRFFISIFLTVVATALSSSASSQQKPPRVALIIGNADYPDAGVPLSTTLKDARALAQEFRRVNFDVDLKENVGKADMQQAINAFTGKIRSGSPALFYFNGYGIQVARRTYLIPLNAQIWNESDVQRDGISLDSVLAEMNRKGAKVKIIIVDASRRNPFERRFRSYAEGLAALDATDGTLAIFSAAPGKLVSDAVGANSLFTGELIKELRAPNVSAEEVFNHTRLGVSRASNGEQTPWVASSLGEQFYFGMAPIVGGTSLGPVPTKSTEAVVPESIPFITDRDRKAIRADYLPAREHKALAISTSVSGFMTGQKSIESARRGALENCQRTQNVINRENKCELYAEDDTIVYARGSPPMPPKPWVSREPSIERQLSAKDVPLMSHTSQGWVQRNYLPSAKPKALAIGRTGYSMARIGQGVDEVVRRALEICGSTAGSPCMIVAIDDAFVVPIPTKMKAVGIFRAESSSEIVAGERENVARRLLAAKNGWHAVAVGKAGRPGLAIDAKSEQAAIDGALADCGKQDGDCRVIGLGPFEVVPREADEKVAVPVATACTKSIWRINDASPNATSQWIVASDDQCRASMTWSVPTTTVALSTAPSHGTVTIEGNTGLMYKSNPGYQGSDTFAITVRWTNNGGDHAGKVQFAVTVK